MPKRNNGQVILDPNSTMEETYFTDEVGIANVKQIAIIDGEYVSIKQGENLWRFTISENGIEISLHSFPGQIAICPRASNVVSLRAPDHA